MRRKVVMITGCSTGIGRALCEEFNRCGFKVIATALDLASIADLKAKGIDTFLLDVNNKDQIHRIIKTISDQDQHIDILVNNAGYALMGPVIEISEAQLHMQFQTNVFSALYLTQQVAPIMKQAGRGLIINIGSVSGITPTPFSGVYCASKAALHVLTDVLRMELGVFNIKVVLVQPGGIQTQLGVTAKNKLSQVLKIDSWYKAVRDSILSRAEASQINATPVDQFAKRFVRAVIVKNPPSYIRIGKKSLILPALKKLVPTNTLDWILTRKFGLKKPHFAASKSGLET